MPSCLMLDVDGVLITGRPRDGAPWASTIAEDLGIDPAALQARFFRPFWERIVTGRLDITPALRQGLARMGARVSAEQLLDYWFANDARIDPGVRADCARLRAGGTRVFLATNQEHLRARHIMETLGLGAETDGIVYSAELGTRKPDPAFFAAAAARTGCPAAAHVLVDDSPGNVAAAREAGWAARLWTGDRSLAALVQDAGG